MVKYEIDKYKQNVFDDIFPKIGRVDYATFTHNRQKKR